MKINKLINISYNACISGERIENDVITKLFEINPVSEAALYMREYAYRAALIVTEGKAYLWGLLHGECMSCFLGKGRFVNEMCIQCAVNGSESGDKVYSPAALYKEQGIHSLILNISEGVYENIWLKNIMLLRNMLDYRCGILIDADLKIQSSGVCFKSTGIKSFKTIIFEDRNYTSTELTEILIKAIQDSRKYSCIILNFTEGRKHVFFSDEKIAQITAVFRLVAGGSRKDLCVYPTTKKSSISGANVAIISVAGKLKKPYFDNFMTGKEVKTMFFKAGYKI